jgi:curved DNA-binding protein CbpA
MADWLARHPAPPPPPPPPLAAPAHLRAHLALLGLAWPCDWPAVRSAWRRAASATHPDHNGSAAAFRRAREAHKALAVSLR